MDNSLLRIRRDAFAFELYKPDTIQCTYPKHSEEQEVRITRGKEREGKGGGSLKKKSRSRHKMVFRNSTGRNG